MCPFFSLDSGIWFHDTRVPHQGYTMWDGYAQPIPLLRIYHTHPKGGKQGLVMLLPRAQPVCRVIIVLHYTHTHNKHLSPSPFQRPSLPMCPYARALDSAPFHTDIALFIPCSPALFFYAVPPLVSSRLKRERDFSSGQKRMITASSSFSSSINTPGSFHRESEIPVYR